MQTEQEIIDECIAAGYSIVFPWQAEAGEVDFEHAHSTDAAQIVMSGEITFRAGGTDVVVRPGERHVALARTAHSAVCGPEGCYYIFALK